MVILSHDLPDDIQTLKRLVIDRQAVIDNQAAELASTKSEIQALTLLITKLTRQQYGLSSEKIAEQIGQLELGP